MPAAAIENGQVTAMKMSRRNLIRAGGLALASGAMVSGRAQAANIPEAPMANSAKMEPPPANTIPMMTGFAQFGPVEMGGMFSVVKVRQGIAT